jgi:hypothetical protein
MASEVISRYDRNQKDPAVMVAGEVINTAILVRQREEEEEHSPPDGLVSAVHLDVNKPCVICDVSKYNGLQDFLQHHSQMEEAYVLCHQYKAAEQEGEEPTRIHVGYYCRDCNKIILKDEYEELKEKQLPSFM